VRAATHVVGTREPVGTLKSTRAAADTHLVDAGTHASSRARRATLRERGHAGDAGDAGDIIGSWLIKVTLILAVLGFIAFDTISVLSTNVTLEDTAFGSARAATDATQDNRNVQLAYDRAQAFASKQNLLNTVDPASVRFGEDGSVTVTVTRTATTLVLQHLGSLQDWASQSATRTAQPR